MDLIKMKRTSKTDLQLTQLSTVVVNRLCHSIANSNIANFLKLLFFFASKMGQFCTLKDSWQLLAWYVELHRAEKLETEARRELGRAPAVRESSLATVSESQQINSHRTVSQQADVQWLIGDNERGWAGTTGERQGCWGPLLARRGMAEGVKGRVENFKVSRILAFCCSWPRGHPLEMNRWFPRGTLAFDWMSRVEAFLTAGLVFRTLAVELVIKMEVHDSSRVGKSLMHVRFILRLKNKKKTRLWVYVVH